MWHWYLSRQPHRSSCFFLELSYSDLAACRISCEAEIWMEVYGCSYVLVHKVRGFEGFFQVPHGVLVVMKIYALSI